MYAEGHVMIDTERSNFEQNYIQSSDFYRQEDSQEDQQEEEQQESSTPNEGSEAEGELEYYFSCHERMIKDYSAISKSGSDVFSGINKDDLKDNFTMPELSRSTLVDQIDYDLYNYKINESSMYDSSGESAFMTNKKN